MASVMERAERRLSEWIVARRWWFLVLAPLAVLALATGMASLEFRGDYRVFFSQENPQLQAFDKLEKTYTQDDNVIFVLIPEDGAVFSRKTLAAVEDLTEMAWQIPYGLRVDSVTNFQYTEADEDMLIVRDLLRGAARASDEEIARVREIALAEPLLVGKLVTQTGNLTLVNVTIQLPRVDEMAEIPAVVRATDRIAREMRERYPHLDVRLSGMVVMTHAFSSAAMNDMRSLMLVSFSIMLVALLLLLRSGWGTLGTFFVILLSVLAGLGAGGHLGIPFTPPSAASPLIILTMAIADSVHILVIFYRELPLDATRDATRDAGRRASREERRQAMAESLRLNLQPVFFTSLTTAVGFLTLNFSEVPPFRDMGNFVATGVAVAFVLSVTFLPALMVLLPARARRPGSENGMMGRFADFVLRNQRRLLWSMAGGVVVLIAFIPQNELNDVFVHYLDERVEFRRDTDVLNEHLGGLYRIDYPLDSGESNGINDPAFLDEVDRFAGWLRGQPEVTHVDTFTDTLKRLNRDLHGGDPAWYRLPGVQEPGAREMAAQYLLLYEMSLPYGLDLNNRIDVDRAATRVSATIRVLSTKEIMALDERARDWFRDNAPELETEGISPTMMFAHIGARNARAMIGATTVALVLISFILIFALRSVKMGLASMIPNLIPAAMGFGVWGMFVGEVGLGLSVVTGMTLGIVVDDTVHFLSKYLRARRERGDSPEEAVRYAFSRVGWALITTTLVLMVGFLIMTLSSFYPNSGMGMLTAIMLGMALITDFLLLPPLLMRIESRADEY